MEELTSPQAVVLAPEEGDTLVGLAYDGCRYYLPAQCQCAVYQYDRHFCPLGRVATRRDYQCLCYDCVGHCFWASTRSCLNTVFQLDSCLREVGKFYLPPTTGVSGVVMGLSHNPCQCTLLVAFPEGVVTFDPKTGTHALLHKVRHGWVTSVLSLSPGYLITQMDACQQSMVVFNHCNEQTWHAIIPPHITVQQLIYDPCGPCPVLRGLITRDCCYQKLATFPLPDLGFPISPCYQALCHGHCNPTPCCGSGNAENDVIESVALMEAALSHILNAEGEKLQKVLATTDDIPTIMCVNRDITQTIIHATHLEQLLYEKLAVIERCRNNPCPPAPCDTP